jgi:hypothetical protein
MQPIGPLLMLIMTGLRAAIAAQAARPHAEAAIMPRTREPELRPGETRRPARPPLPTELFTRAWAFIGRTTARLERLIARWHTNTLPKPKLRTPRPALTAPGTPAAASP